MKVCSEKQVGNMDKHLEHIEAILKHPIEA